jgi:hypothetical protein
VESKEWKKSRCSGKTIQDRGTGLYPLRDTFNTLGVISRDDARRSLQHRDMARLARRPQPAEPSLRSEPQHGEFAQGVEVLRFLTSCAQLRLEA